MVSESEEKVPLVSVVMPTYNQAVFLPYALDSVLDQTWRDYEFIVVNDGSTDDTPHILDEYQQRRNLRVIHQENQKLPGALNTGFRQARGRYLTWTSSDNIMLPQMLEVLVETLDRHPEVGMVYADWEVIDEHGEITGRVKTFDFDRFLLMRINYINACFLYRRTCQETVGLYDPQYWLAEDWEYWLRISRAFEVMRVPRFLYQFRVHGASLTEAEVRTRDRGRSEGYSRLAVRLRAQPLAWYWSKLKWEWLKIRLGQNPGKYLRYY